MSSVVGEKEKEKRKKGKKNKKIDSLDTGGCKYIDIGLDKRGRHELRGRGR